jgi:hypothetical protein
MPTNQALQVFYGTIPLILVLLAIWFREQLLLKDILTRLSALDAAVKAVETKLGKVIERLVVLETRAGVIYHE